MADNIAIDQKQLGSELESNLRQDASAKETFCRCWPCAKDILELLLKLPNLPKQVADVIKVIVAVGDKAAAAVCK